ncbi:MAG: hypothetical protein R3C58_12880 [Parvularculaceae bacterium]
MILAVAAIMGRLRRGMIVMFRHLMLMRRVRGMSAGVLDRRRFKRRACASSLRHAKQGGGENQTGDAQKSQHRERFPAGKIGTPMNRVNRR